MNKSSDILYQDNDYELILSDDGMRLKTCKDGKLYNLSSHYYEPCTYIEDENGNKAVLHDGFDLSFVIGAIQAGKDLRWIGGKKTPHEFCEIMIDTLNNSLEGR
ncbi:hypothetical protein [Butyrivibrio hungatei]|uniref:Uncharacterized protein n=1 Tax=Butyrivibrio hungatei TaxID=185008 RepID=A0A1D9P5N6_9FIRM|nr:hypothetical protein [Butyrivibrio hungatei]AOZ97849.1 hypothetical protein bhn_II050 [Butyrivibrio hungatei]